MKSLLVLLAVGSMSLSAAITGTKHDLSSAGPGAKGNTTQTCVFCHTPHGSAAGAAQIIPLWNKATTVTTGFTMYASGGTITGTIDATPTGASMACFTCHDGTQSVGNVINMPYGVAGTSITMTAGGGVSALGIMSGINALGKDLSNDHPVSITYNETLDTGLKTATTLVGVRLFPSNVTGSKVQCASCHNVHDNTNAPFLRVSNAASALCTSCHIK